MESLEQREFSFVLSESLFGKLIAHLRSITSPNMLNLFVNRFKIAMQTSMQTLDTFVELPTSETNMFNAEEDDSRSSGPLHFSKNEDENLTTETTPARESIHFLRNSVDSLIPNISLHTMSDKYVLCFINNSEL